MTNQKVAAVAAYITWIGFLIAILIGDRGDGFVAHHLNQALVINLLSIFGGVIAIIPILGSTVSWVISIAVFAFMILGIYRAATGSTEPLPLIGDIHLIG
jgi:uncharacterized membrane protein